MHVFADARCEGKIRRREPSEILLKRFRAAAAAFVLTLRKSYKKQVLRKNTHVHTHARAFKRAKSPAQSGVVIIRLIKARCPLLFPPREKRASRFVKFERFHRNPIMWTDLL